MKFGTQQEFERTPHLKSIMPQEIRLEVEKNRLPYLRCDSLVLEQGEICHYADRAIYEKKIRRPRAQTKRPGGIFRSRGPEENSRDTVLDIVFEQISGILYITGRRILFSGEGEYWTKNLDELLAAKPYLNCVKFQFGRDSYKVFVPDGSLPHAVIRLLRTAGESET